MFDQVDVCLMRKALCHPRQALHRLKLAILRRAKRIILKHSRYDYALLYSVISQLTAVSPENVKGYYEELYQRGVLDEIRSLIEHIPELQAAHRSIRYLGIEKYVRLDRTALYCIVRATKPEVFVETGTRWGLGSFFIARAMEENRKGHLWTFDIGVHGSKAQYFWPERQSRLGFLIPRRLSPYLTIVEGNSVNTLPHTLAQIPKVDIFYHDSLHTFEHMRKEYGIVFPHMSNKGLFMSEDTDMNDAYQTFIKGKHYECEGRYCSHLGVFHEREVSGIRLCSLSSE